MTEQKWPSMNDLSRMQSPEMEEWCELARLSLEKVRNGETTTNPVPEELADYVVLRAKNLSTESKSLSPEAESFDLTMREAFERAAEIRFGLPGQVLLKISLSVDTRDGKPNTYNIGTWIAPNIGESDLETLAKECITFICNKRASGTVLRDLEMIG